MTSWTQALLLLVCCLFSGCSQPHGIAFFEQREDTFKASQQELVSLVRRRQLPVDISFNSDYQLPNLPLTATSQLLQSGIIQGISIKHDTALMYYAKPVEGWFTNRYGYYSYNEQPITRLTAQHVIPLNREWKYVENAVNIID